MTERDAATLDAFMRRRGGAVILAPDRPMMGPVTRLLPQRWHPQLDGTATDAGPLRASAWLIPTTVTSLDRIWAKSSHGPVVVGTPVGAGMVVVAGAMDAWRHRGDGAYDRFWRATVATLAATAGDVVDLRVDRSAPHLGGELRVLVRGRAVRDVAIWNVRAARLCEDRPPTVLRLWPSNANGEFSAELPEYDGAECRVQAVIDAVGQAAERHVPRLAAGAAVRWSRADMDRIATRSGGSVVETQGVSDLVRTWLDARGAERRLETHYPMRSWWWSIPFACSLAGEWWLRRRVGVR